jgi:hypothetical protein
MSYKDKEQNNSYMRGYRAAHREQYRAYQRATNTRGRQRLHVLKNKPCVDCGGKFPPYIMHFHHRNPSTKTYNVGSMVNRKLSDIEAEIAKCDLLCANCHGIRTYEEQ